jgi:uncharacterized membrane protein YccC
VRLGREHHLDVAAPDWMVRVVRPLPVPVPWLDMLRMALTVSVPLAVALAVGQLRLGVFAAMGALACGLADRGGPVRIRLLRAGSAAVAGGVGLVIGRVVAVPGWYSVILIAVLAALSAVISVINSILSLAGLQLLVYTAIGSGLRVPQPPYLLSLLFIAGGTWAVLLSLARAYLEGGALMPERAAVAEVYRRIAGLLAATGTPTMPQARQALTDALNDAYDTLLGARATSAGRNMDYQRLAALLNAAAPVTESAVAIAHRGRPPDPEVRLAVSGLAGAILRNQRPLPFPQLEQETPLLRALRRGYGVVVEHFVEPPTAGSEPALAPPTLRGRLESAADRLLTGPNTRRYVVRLVLCMGVAELLRSIVPLQRSYWMLLTVAIVLKPDFGSVFARAVQRGLGTLVGVVIGAGLLLIVPTGAYLLPFIAVFAATLPYAFRRNFGMFSTFLTPLAVLLIDLGSPQGSTILTTRLLDTLAGCGIVLVLGYLIWPSTWRVRLGPQVADAVDALGDYLEAAFAGDDSLRARQRRRSYRALSEVRTALQQLLAEPPPAGHAAAAWWPMIVQLERTADAITHTATQTRDSRSAPDPAHVAELHDAIRDLAAALRERRPPVLRDPPDDAVLDPVTEEIRTARKIASGVGGSDRRGEPEQPAAAGARG